MDDKWQPWVQQMDVHHSVNKISLAYSSCADQQFVIYPVDGLVKNFFFYPDIIRISLTYLKC